MWGENEFSAENTSNALLSFMIFNISNITIVIVQ